MTLRGRYFFLLPLKHYDGNHFRKFEKNTAMLVLNNELEELLQMTEPQIKLELVIAAYKDNKIGWGKGAETLGITQMQLWKELADRGLDVIKNDESYRREFKNL